MPTMSGSAPSLGTSIATGELEDNSVTNPKLADNAVNTAEIANDAVTHAKIATLEGAATTTDVLESKVTGDTQNRWVLDADGAMRWGPGNASTDVLLQRSSAQELRVYEALLNVARDLATNAALGAIVTGDTQYRFIAFADGKHEWGSGAGARDTNLYRENANILATDDKLHVLDELEVDGALNHDGTTVGFYGVAPVARSAAYTASNVTTDRSYDANATTLDELADVLGTLITDLKATGIIG